MKKMPSVTEALPLKSSSITLPNKPNDPSALAVYVHWPFCVSKCPYCDFNSHVAGAINHDDWRNAYVRELESYKELLPGRTLSSVFFGGGTPSLMEPETVGLVLNTLSRLWPLSSNIEITLEANPSSVEAEKLTSFRASGINRLSLGIQSLDDVALKFLGRAHNSQEALRAIDHAQKTFDRFSFDLIYARQDQSLSSWELELKRALTLAKGHLSLYQLTIEPNTQFYTLARRGTKLTAPDEEAALMFEMTQNIMNDAGLPAYEISNHAQKGHESRHNLTYWHYDDYIGIGPGAHGRHLRDHQRFAVDNHRAPDHWLRHVHEEGWGTRLIERLDEKTQAREALMMGLRLNEGLDSSLWQNKFGFPLEEIIAAEKVMRLRTEGYLTSEKERLRTTKEGAQRLNAVLSYLIN